MTVNDMLAESVLMSRRQLVTYLSGFDDSNHTRNAINVPNHAAWVLGHCAMTMHRAGQRLDGAGLPPADFIEGSAVGDTRRFGTESISAGSAPSTDSSQFPSWGRCSEVFDASAERLARTLRSASAESLEKPTKFFGGLELPAWNIVPRIVFHNGNHCGQLADLRRALGLPRLFG